MYANHERSGQNKAHSLTHSLTHSLRKLKRFFGESKQLRHLIKSFFFFFLLLTLFLTIHSSAQAATLFSDDFTGTTIDTSKWTEHDTGTNVDQNNALTIKGNSTWNSNGVESVSTFTRGNSLTLEAWAKTPTTNQYHSPVGYGDWGAVATGTPGKDITFIDFYNTGVFKTFLFINGTKTEDCLSTTSYTANRWYKIQLLVGDSQGATYKIYADSNDDGDFNDAGEDTDIFSSDICHSISGGTFTNKRFIAQSYSTGTITLDNVSVSNSASDSISITTPKEYQVIQRNGSNEANISISGTYAGAPSAIEASWNGGSYTTIDSDLSGGTFSGTLSNQVAGQGTLTVRFTNDNNVSASTNYIGIGDIFIIAGQSNASGRGTNNQSYSHASLKATLFGNDDNWKELTDPTDSNTNQVDSVSDDSAAAGTVYPLIATLYLASQNVPIVFVPTAKGATAISQWQRNDVDPDDTTTLYGSMYRRISAVGGSVKAVLFWQGESDVIAGTSQSNYKTSLDAFANDVYSDFGVKTIVAQIGPFTGQTAGNIDNIRLAQVSAWNDGGNVLPGPSLYDVNLTDTVHFKSNSELQTAANRWWAAIEKNYYSGADGRGPVLTAAEYNSTKTQVNLTFSDDSPPLLPASGYSGFTAKDNDVSKTISTIEKIGTNQLKITLQSAASGSITISLGEGDSGKGATIPTDSSTYNLPAEIFVNQATTALDETSPVISSVSSGTPTSTGATITWSTNEDSSSKVDYGLTNSYGSTTSETDTSPRVQSHSITLSGLVACSTYHYRVKSKDAAANEGVGTDNSFTTSGCTGSASVDSQTASTITTASGGSVNLLSDSKGVTLTVPASFAGADANFQIKQLNKTSVTNTTSTPTGYSLIGSYLYDLKALTDVSTSVSSFNSAITVSVAYGSSDVSGINESGLKIYRWDGSNWNQLSNCSVNTSTKNVSCTTTAFSVFGLFGQASTNSSSSSSSTTSSSTSAPSCGDTPPGAKAPWLYGAIAQDSSSVLLYFTEADNPLNKYVLEYGTKSGDYPYGVQDMGVNSRGPMTFLVKSLSPNTTYYFRVRGGNGCATGPWSNEISAKTKGLVSFNQLEITQSELETKPIEEVPKVETCQIYVVKSGDTLWSIAKNLLGDGSKYREIIEQNKDKYLSLEGSNNISSGWELKISCGKETKEEVPKTTEVPAEGGYNVKVKVVDTNKKAVEGAKVTIHSKVQEAITNKDGIAEFKNVEVGEHKVIIAYKNFEGEQSVNLAGEVKEFNLNVTIQPKAVILSPLAYGIIGVMGLIIVILLVLLIKAKRGV